MKKEFPKAEAQNIIDKFFLRQDFSPDEVRKIRRLAMKYKIKLGNYRKIFCKKCLSHLSGEISLTKTQKSVRCSSCGFRNKFKLS